MRRNRQPGERKKQFRLLCRLLALACLLLPLSIIGAQNVQPSPVRLPTQMVKLTMIVTDAKDHSVEDVRDEIQLEGDKLAQTIVSLSRDQRLVDYALVVDNYGSFKELLPAVVES